MIHTEDWETLLIAFCLCFIVSCLTFGCITADKEKTKQTEIIYNDKIRDNISRELMSNCGAEWNAHTNSWRCTR